MMIINTYGMVNEYININVDKWNYVLVSVLYEGILFVLHICLLLSKHSICSFLPFQIDSYSDYRSVIRPPTVGNFTL